MKKYFIPFLAVVFTGSFDAVDQAANAHAEGSAGPNGANFTEVEKEGSKTLTFTDHNGTPQTLTPGDALVAVYSEGGAFVGYQAASAAEVATWQEVPAPVAAAE